MPKSILLFLTKTKLSWTFFQPHRHFARSRAAERMQNERGSMFVLQKTHCHFLNNRTNNLAVIMSYA